MSFKVLRLLHFFFVLEEKSNSEFIIQSEEKEYCVEYDKELAGLIELSVSVNGSCSFGGIILVIFLVEYFLTVRSILLFVTLSFFFPDFVFSMYPYISASTI